MHQIDPALLSRVTALYSDGSVVKSNPSPIGGSWAWCAVDADNQRIIEQSGFLAPSARMNRITNNHTEFVAALAALAAMPDGWSGDLVVDSQVTMHRITTIRHSAAAPIPNLPDAWVKRAAAVLNRLGTVALFVCAGHPSATDLAAGITPNGIRVSPHNVWCDKECTRRNTEALCGLDATGHLVVADAYDLITPAKLADVPYVPRAADFGITDPLPDLCPYCGVVQCDCPMRRKPFVPPSEETS
jgi:ribonuclease HI